MFDYIVYILEQDVAATGIVNVKGIMGDGRGTG